MHVVSHLLCAFNRKHAGGSGCELTLSTQDMSFPQSFQRVL